MRTRPAEVVAVPCWGGPARVGEPWTVCAARGSAPTRRASGFAPPAASTARTAEAWPSEPPRASASRPARRDPSPGRPWPRVDRSIDRWSGGPTPSRARWGCRRGSPRRWGAPIRRAAPLQEAEEARCEGARSAAAAAACFARRPCCPVDHAGCPRRRCSHDRGRERKANRGFAADRARQINKRRERYRPKGRPLPTRSAKSTRSCPQRSKARSCVSSGSAMKSKHRHV